MIKKVESSAQAFFNRLQQKIEIAEKQNKPIKDLVEQQIKLLSEVHDEFIADAKLKGYDMTNQRLGEIEVRQYQAMKQLAQKIGLPVEEYDEYIKKVRIRIFGEENYKRFFEEQ